MTLRPRRCRGLALAAVLTSLPTALVTGCADMTGAAGETSEPEVEARVQKRDPVRVLVEPVVQKEMVRVLETATRVESEHQLELFPRAGGVLVELLVEEGDRVRAGQVLARMDQREAQIAVEDAKTALAEAEAELPKLELAKLEAEARLASAERAAEQAKRDHERNLAIAGSKDDDDRLALISSKDLEASKLAVDQAVGEQMTARLALQRAQVEEKNGAAAVQRAQFTLDSAELSLSFTSLEAPIDGVIAQRNVDVGDTLTAGAAAFTLTDPDRLRTVFFRPQRELALFRGDGLSDEADGGAGRRAPLELTARSEAVPGHVFRGKIERIAPVIDPESGNFRVTARLERGAVDAPHVSLMPGMLVRIQIVTDRHADALVVPKRALRREGDRTRIFLARDGVARSVEVTEGFAGEDDTEVVPVDGELAPGDLVIVVGNRDLEDGTEVKLPDARPAAASAEPATASAQAEEVTGAGETTAASDSESEL